MAKAEVVKKPADGEPVPAEAPKQKAAKKFITDLNCFIHNQYFKAGSVIELADGEPVPDYFKPVK